MTRTRAKGHTKHAYYCTCGKVVRGNGGKARHARMHQERGDWRTENGHNYMTYSAWLSRTGGK